MTDTATSATPGTPMVSALQIGEPELEAIRRHAAATYPHECCGALIGSGDHVSGVFELPNTTEEGPRRRFLVRAQDYREAEKRARATGSDLIGFYHSHPDHPARPSAYDLEHAWPVFAYIIISVREGTPEAITSWRLREDRSAFDEQDIQRET